MSEKLALIPGSMNPFTRGHRYVVDTSLVVFDRVIVGIGMNNDKHGQPALFSDAQKLQMARACVADLGDRVEVVCYAGTSVAFANERSACAIVRGIRNGTDHAYEASMSYANSLMSESEFGHVIPTFYIQCPPALTEVSATRLRELISLRCGARVLEEYAQRPVIELIEKEIYG